MFGSDQDNWFKSQKIPFPEDYSLEKNRESLKTIFTFSDMKIYGVLISKGFINVLMKQKRHFLSIMSMQIDIIQKYYRKENF